MYTFERLWCLVFHCVSCCLSINFSIISLRLINFLFSYVNKKMHNLKAYVRNKAYPEGSIVEDYTDHECLNFCSIYFYQANEMKHYLYLKTIHLLGAAIHNELTLSNWAKIRWYVDIKNKLEMEFHRLFSKRVPQLQNERSTEVTEDLKILSNEPKILVTRYIIYLVKREHGGKSVNFYGVLKDIVEYKNDPFVLACQTRQVFYSNDIKLGNDWGVVDKS
ncbi:hypothetical protein ACOSP7_032050 [Xanthoceras sorbifolium]